MLNYALVLDSKKESLSTSKKRTTTVFDKSKSQENSCSFLCNSSVYNIFPDKSKVLITLALLFLITATLFFHHNIISRFGKVSFEHEIHYSERFLVIKEILKNYSNVDSLEDERSPQYKALDWIANRDMYQIDPMLPLFIQRYTLAVLYYSTNGPITWKASKNFLSPIHECNWQNNGGVRKCDDDGRVTDVSLWNGLTGIIPTEIGYLTSLTTLYLSRNEIAGTIPSEVGRLSNLEYLGLSNNKLSGTVPEESLGNLKKIQFLMIGKNDLTGTIRKISPICRLFKDALLQKFISDCGTIVDWRPPEISCFCCTRCLLA